MQAPAEIGRDWIGQTLDGRYRIERVLGAGGLGTVYLATQLRLDRRVAVKMLHRELLPSIELRKRFDREVATLSRLSHPHIVALTDSGVLEDGMGYLVMELLEGLSLEDKLRASGALDPSEAVEITRQMLLGLAEAHDKGVLHRDLKPANVFLHPLAEGVHVKLLDFGLAKVRSDIATHPGAYPTLTADGVIVGTPTYMAPEQATGGKVTVAADLYAVGIVLYEMLAGRPPFRSDDKLETIRAHMLAPVPELDAFAPELSPTDALRAFVHRALKKEYAQRFPDARTMLRELDALPVPVAVVEEGKRAARAASARPSSASSAGTEDTMALRSAELEPMASGPGDVARAPDPPRAAQPAVSGPQSRAPRPWARAAVVGLATAGLLGVTWMAWSFARPPSEASAPLPAPREPAPAPSPDTETETDALEAGEFASPFAHGELPDELRSARRDVSRGHGLSDDEERAVQTYRRAHPGDCRAPLLLARSARFHGEWSSVVELYGDAYAADASAVGFAPMLGDLIRAAGDPSASGAASDAIVRMFGQSAVEAVDARLDELPDGPEHRLIARLRRRLAGD